MDGEFHPHDSTPLILADLTPYIAVLNESTEIRNAAGPAIALLQKIDTPDAIAALEQAAETHEVEDVAAAAADALIWIAHAHAIQAEAEAMDTDSTDIEE